MQSIYRSTPPAVPTDLFRSRRDRDLHASISAGVASRVPNLRPYAWPVLLMLLTCLLVLSGKALAANAPDAPVNVVATAGNGQAIVTFAAPASDGGEPITSYTVVASPGGASASASASPIVVTGLSNGTAYSFTMTATNSIGNSPASAASNAVTPTALAGSLVSVESRKTHGAAGSFGLPIEGNIPVGGAVTVEPRAIGSGHTIVFTFENMISNPGTASVTDEAGQSIGSATPAVTGAAQNEVSVNLTNLIDNTRAAISLSGVNGSINVGRLMGFMVGDVSNSRRVNASDISSVKARAGQLANAGSFRFDVDASGEIDSADLTATRANTGRVLPTIAPMINSVPPPAGQIGFDYNHIFRATSSTSVTWNLTAGALPTGLTLISGSGLLSGNPSAGGTFTFTLTATNANGSTSQVVSIFIVTEIIYLEAALPNPSKFPNVVPPYRDRELNGAGPDLNAYPIDPARCAGKTSPPLTRSWQHNINFADYSGQSPVDYVTMDANEALSFRFVAPAAGYRFITFNPATLGRFVDNFLSISTSPCDFDESPAPSIRGCYAPGNGGNNTITYQMIGTGSPDPGACKLTPGTTYYLNLRFWKQVNGTSVDACAVDPQANGSNCGGILQIR